MARNWVTTPRRMRALRAIDVLLAPVALASRLRRRRPLPAAPRILVFEFWRLGDAVMAEPLLRELRARFPRAEISLLCSPAARLLLEPGGTVDQFIDIDVPWTAFTGKYEPRRYSDPRFTSTIRALRRQRFDISIDSRMDLRSNILAWIIGAHRRIGFDVPGGRGLLTDRVADGGAATHKVLDWLAMLGPLGGANAEPRSPLLAVRESTQEVVDHRLRDLGVTPNMTLIAIQPSARQAVRRWRLDRFESVARALTGIQDTKVLVFVDPDGYGEAIDAPGSIRIRAGIEELPAYLHRCAVFVGNDSGPAHIAAAAGSTAVTIFGPGAIDWFRPFGPGQRVVRAEPMPCRPCFDHCIHATNICLEAVTVEMVLDVVREVLAARRATTVGGTDSCANAGNGSRVDVTTATREIAE